MNTLKLNTQMTTKDLDTNNRAPSFMEGAMSVLQRNINQPNYVERWIKPTAHVQDATQATTFETEMYALYKDAEFLAMMNEPDPIPVHTAEDWAYLTEDDGIITTVMSRDGIITMDSAA